MSYKVLNRNSFTLAGYTIIPLRYEDMHLIKQWRNDQLAILRQKTILTDEQQTHYFNHVVKLLFVSDHPEQVLFSLLFQDELIGYGGLVHIDWEYRRAEISFLLESERNRDLKTFQNDFSHYLKLIKVVAFEELGLRKINTEAYDIRPYLYKPLEENGFIEEARLRSHNFIDGRQVDTVFHSFFSRSHIQPADEVFNVLVTSISNKVPMITRIRNAFDRLPVKGKLFGGDIDSRCIGSHFVDVFWEMPLLSEDILDDLIGYCLENNIKAIIPSRDGELLFWASHRMLFIDKGINIMVSGADAIRSTVDKLIFYKRGIELGYPVIPTALDSKDVKAERYVVKERFGAGAKSIGLCLSPEEAFQQASKLSAPVFQPFVRGTEYSIDVYITRAGEIKGAVSRTREKIVNGESQITAVSNMPELESLCSGFAGRLNLSGHVVFQALVDENNKYHIIECNSRFGGASTLSIAAGLDSFYWFLLESTGRNILKYDFVRAAGPLKQTRHACDTIGHI